MRPINMSCVTEEASGAACASGPVRGCVRCCWAVADADRSSEQEARGNDVCGQ